ncbi:hypothetical protein M409DRAFT_55431 [Zasmidium cellare ATCC 36951]|uniref:UBL3-like ubiquitin domain-containing protein n=1 Tax=Zasmidium cellare ATCC 36951 TaxID=1080233 RepID=A0A6A6CIS6_ZASCE|nr:uncharacterized protein M409DRAFT_55431 [Zasmidium cellare ATCC 36951]KAF2166088.1 hypothetical protein M409DRAFT_55431 [Zasmidium cellare ATCC 36951]
MASQPDTVAGASAPPAAQTIPSQIDTTHAQSSEQPLEMSELPASPRTVNEEFADAVQQQEPQHATDAAPAPSADAPAPLERKETEALGPATDAPITTAASAGPTLNISLMLTTGVRHPYKIDEKYLRNRKVEAKNAEDEFDPREISGYKLKELIWTDWRKEWEPRPMSPSSIRLIIMGKMIEDKKALKEFNFNVDGPNVLHMTVKPADLIDDDETAEQRTPKLVKKLVGEGLRRMGQEMQAEALHEELEILERRYREAEDWVDEPPTTLRGNSWDSQMDDELLLQQQQGLVGEVENLQEEQREDAQAHMQAQAKAQEQEQEQERVRGNKKRGCGSGGCCCS